MPDVWLGCVKRPVLLAAGHEGAWTVSSVCFLALGRSACAAPVTSSWLQTSWDRLQKIGYGLQLTDASFGDQSPRGACTSNPYPRIQTAVDKYVTNLTRKDVKGIIEAVATIGHAELKKNEAIPVWN